MPTDPASLPGSLPRLSRRGALLGAAALLAPLTPKFNFIADATADTPIAASTGIIHLDGNENPYGPSPAARRAILASVLEAPRYAFEAIAELTRLIAERDQLDRGQVVIGTGSGELLKVVGLVAAEAGPSSELVAARPTFEELPGFAAKIGVATRWVPLDSEHRHDLAAMHTAIGAHTRLVYVCNPNNPTGTTVARSALEAFIRAVPDSTLILVDEAYMDLADAPGVGSAVALVRECRNLVVLRTFSKIHGLAGLRIGYGVASPDLASRISKKLVTWPNSTGLRAAIASLGDDEFLRSTRAALVGDRQRVEAAVDRLGRPRAQSQGNFVFFDTGMPLSAFAKRMLDLEIRVARRFDGYDNWARITIGTRSEVDRLLAALPAALRVDG